MSAWLFAVLLIGTHLAALVLGLLTKRSHWMRVGAEATEREHGWRSDPYLNAHLPREHLWSLRDHKVPSVLVERHITPTSERPLPR